MKTANDNKKIVTGTIYALRWATILPLYELKTIMYLRARLTTFNSFEFWSINLFQGRIIGSNDY